MSAGTNRRSWHLQAVPTLRASACGISFYKGKRNATTEAACRTWKLLIEEVLSHGNVREEKQFVLLSTCHSKYAILLSRFHRGAHVQETIHHYIGQSRRMIAVASSMEFISSYLFETVSPTS
jgi:hypothetical protein